MIKTELQIGKTLEISGFKITPVETIHVESDMGEQSGWWHGSKELYALVIAASTGAKAFDQDGRELNVNELLQKIPLLAHIIAV